MLWAPREYELFRLMDNSLAEDLLWSYLQRAPVAESFIWRRWLYVLWDEVAQLVNTGRFNRRNSIWHQNHFAVARLTNLSATARSGQAFHSQRGRYASTKPEKDCPFPRIKRRVDGQLIRRGW